MKKLIYVLGFLGTASLACGTTLKLLNVPNGYGLFMLGFVLILLVFLPLFALIKYRQAGKPTVAEKWRFILGGLAAVFAGLAGVFKLLHLQGAVSLLILGNLLFVLGFLPLYFYSLYKRTEGPK